MRWRRHDDDERVQLVEDVRRLAGFADAAVDKATRLGVEVPEGVAACSVVWRHWAGRLAQWARPAKASERPADDIPGSLRLRARRLSYLS